jgi:hypothetical protein
MKTTSSFFLLLLIFSLFSCSSKEEKMLKGRWEFEKLILPDNRVFTANDSSNLNAEKNYDFYPENMYLYESIQYIAGEGQLIVKRGKYEVNKEKEKVFLTLKEKQLEGSSVKVYQILTLDEGQLIWENQHKGRYFFKKTVE